LTHPWLLQQLLGLLWLLLLLVLLLLLPPPGAAASAAPACSSSVMCALPSALTPEQRSLLESMQSPRDTSAGDASVQQSAVRIHMGAHCTLADT